MKSVLRGVLAALAGVSLWACTTLTGVADLEEEAGDGAAPSVSPTASSSASSSSSTSSTAGGAPDASPSSSHGDAASMTTSASSSTSSSSSSSSSSSGAPTPPTFSDNFDRTASATVGNGWTEKTDHFSIQDNQVADVSTADDGYYNIVLWSPQPATDVLVAFDVTYPSPDTSFTADPTLVVRAPDSSLTTYNTYDGYTFYATRDFVSITREDAASAQTELASQAIQPALTAGAQYHFTFKVTGTSPVALTGTISQGNTVIATLSYNDADPAKAFTAGGHVGIGCSTKGVGLKWDNFVQTTYQ